MTGDDGIAPAFYATPGAWRAWLEAHHAGEREHWVGFHRRDTGRESITWPEAVDQALCFGWIDGIRKRVDENRYMIRFTPRKRTSHWSMVNVRRVGELREAGLMHPAGLEAFAARSEERTGNASYEQRDAAAFDPERERRLRADAAAWEYFSAQAPWYRRTATHWVMSAKREETRDRRLARLIEDCAAGRPTGPLARP